MATGNCEVTAKSQAQGGRLLLRGCTSLGTRAKPHLGEPEIEGRDKMQQVDGEEG